MGCWNGHIFPEDFGLSSETVEQMPDLSIDPESGLLTCVNKHESNIRTFYISVSQGLDVDLKDMEDGMARDIDGNTFSCVVVVLPPQARLTYVIFKGHWPTMIIVVLWTTTRTSFILMYKTFLHFVCTPFAK